MALRHRASCWHCYGRAAAVVSTSMGFVSVSCSGSVCCQQLGHLAMRCINLQAIASRRLKDKENMVRGRTTESPDTCKECNLLCKLWTA